MKTCPLVKGPCLEHGCKFYIHVLGQHPQTGAQMDSWDCAISFVPILLINLGKVTNEVGAAVESLRNETSAHVVHGISESIRRIGDKR